MSNAKRYWAETEQLADMRIAKYVERVFKRLAEYHTEEKRNKAIGMGTDALVVKSSWAREFSLMTPEMVESGAKKVRDQSFCPNLARFTQLCKVSGEEAYAEAQMGMTARARGDFGVWSCPAVYFAAVEFGSSDLRERDWLRASARFSKIFERAIERQERGELDVIPAVTLPSHMLENTPITRDAAKVAALVGSVSAALSDNPQSWAYFPKSFTATREMLVSAKNGLLNKDVIEHNLKLKTIVKDGDWFKPVAYVRGDKLVVCV